MARSFDNNRNNRINFGDVTTATFEYNDTWSFLCFWRRNNNADEHPFMSRTNNLAAIHISLYGDNVSGYAIECTDTNGDLILNVGTHGADTWYLAALTNDGTASDNVVLYSYNMDGTLNDSGVGTMDANDTLTHDLRYGIYATNRDSMDGELAYCCYLSETVDDAFFKWYVRQPYLAAVSRGDNLKFFHALGVGDPEPDWSGNGWAGTIEGTLAVGDNPPVTPYVTIASSPGVSGVAPPVTRRIFIT